MSDDSDAPAPITPNPAAKRAQQAPPRVYNFSDGASELDVAELGGSDQGSDEQPLSKARTARGRKRPSKSKQMENQVIKKPKRKK